MKKVNIRSPQKTSNYLITGFGMAVGILKKVLKLILKDGNMQNLSVPHLRRIKILLIQ